MQVTSQLRRLARTGLVVFALLTPLGACRSDPASIPPPDTGRAGAPSAPSRPDNTAPIVGKLLVVMVENHSLDQMRSQMPFTFGLAQDYGYVTHYRAMTHPSLGNYIAIAAGSTFGIVDDRNPVAHPLTGPTVFSQAIEAGGTATIYAEGMPSTCLAVNGGDQYAVRHNPWTYFPDERADCEQHDISSERLRADAAAGDLPTVGVVVPNLCNDAHDCSLNTADGWLQQTLADLTAGPDWRSGRLAIVVTADEDDHHQDNTVLTTVLHPSLRHVVVDEQLTHLSLSRAMSEVAGQPALRDAAGSPSLLQAFGLTTAG